MNDEPAFPASFDSTPGDTAPPSWRPVPRHRAYQQVVAQIEEQILHGKLAVGDRLPPERDLAAMLGVSRAAVREAIRTLEAQGVLHAAVGVGPDGGTTICAMPSQALSRMLRLHVALSNFPAQDVIEARVMLERWSARLAARAAPSEEVARLRRLVDQMDDPGLDRPTFNDYDTEFHVTVAQAGGNVLLADMTTAIRESMRLPILESFRAMPDWETFVGDLRAGHRRIQEAIARGEEEVAADAVEEHIRFAFSALRWGEPQPEER
ncbi:Pyruvate dehydrogenase complex repressor [Austwickia sp. TVS 96-490-7B]|uniref:FadR/GntR family transcriptional regulator n=1 Tax=Austwickia sp. TVS 96-490-7B TaxID=2830843 RepID=UPI001D1EA367|nr:FadR/GntR family transcriptional regulator [Austwickia sp. TVS 96-490-7B]MBW3084600.1 Pyruvate dehydrogenase complex repressor [Austwickia sp. TVS 96-490-7B]